MPPETEHWRMIGETSVEEFWINHKKLIHARSKLRKAGRWKSDQLELLGDIKTALIPRDMLLTPYGVLCKSRGYF